MPRFLVTSGSHFEPFTYDELVKPIEKAQEVHNAADAEYSKLALDTNALAQYISDNPEDSDAKALYDNYRNQLTSLQEALWNNGINAQTRRDLEAARTGYAQDVSKLAKTIAARQEQSKAYWDYRNNNRDAVTGNDPGKIGLNEYLKNENAGRDWFAYSGNQFAKEVGDDAKARVDELLDKWQNRMDIVKDPRLEGRLLVVKKDGFSSQEVAGAKDLVDKVLSGDINKEDVNKDTPEGILADVLINHLDTLDAKDKLSDSEFSRLVEYGKTGLSQAIGKSSTQILDDERWKANLQVETQRRIKALTQPETPRPTITMGSTIDITSPGYTRLAKYTKGPDSYYRDSAGQAKPITLVVDGQKQDVTNSYDMATYLYNAPHREQVRQYLGGIDVALGNKEQTGIANGIRYKSGKLSKDDAERLGLDRDTAIAIYRDYGGGRKELLDQETRVASEASKEVQDRIKQIKADNSQIEDIDKLVVSPAKQAEMRKEWDFPETAPWSDFYDYVTAAETQGTFSVPTLSGSDPAHKAYTEKALQFAFENEWNKAPKDKGKGSKYAVYEVQDGNKEVSTKGITEIGDVLGKHSDGSIAWENMINVDNLFENYSSDRPTMRFQSKHTNKTYQVDAEMFGPLVYQELSAKNPIIGYLSAPIVKPKEVYRMSDKDSENVGMVITKTLLDINNQLPPAQRVSVPVINVVDANGKVVGTRALTAKEFMMNPEYRERLRIAVESLVINPMLENIRDSIQIYHEQYRSNSNSKAE